MAAQKKEFMTIAEIMAAKEGELLESWLENVKALPGTRTLELVTEAQLRTEAAELLRTLVIALGSEEYEDITRPEFGEFNMKGEWVVENYGVDPDIVLDNLPPAVIEGKDPQLEKAVEILMKKIEEHPMILPDRPAPTVEKQP